VRKRGGEKRAVDEKHGYAVENRDTGSESHWVKGMNHSTQTLAFSKKKKTKKENQVKTSLSVRT